MAEVFIPSEEQFREIIEQTVTKILSDKLPSILRRAKRKEWMSSEEAQDFLGVSSRQLQYLRDTRSIPFSQSGRTIFYPTSGLEDWLRKNMPDRWERYLDGEVNEFSSNGNEPG